MGQLQQKMIEDLQLRRLAPTTTETYIRNAHADRDVLTNERCGSFSVVRALNQLRGVAHR